MATKKDNMRIWKQLDTPPKAALREIKFGALKGKSDINPQWRMEAMTEVFGPVGFGWRYEILSSRTIDISDGQVCAFVDVAVYVKDGDEWSAAIPGTGGSMLVDKNKNGLVPSDECFKMATTDALSVAFKAIGVAAEVYKGCLDGSKYEKRQEPQPAQNLHDIQAATYQKIKRSIDGAMIIGDIASIRRMSEKDIKTLPQAGQDKLYALLDQREAEFQAAAN